MERRTFLQWLGLAPLVIAAKPPTPAAKTAPPGFVLSENGAFWTEVAVHDAPPTVVARRIYRSGTVDPGDMLHFLSAEDGAFLCVRVPPGESLVGVVHDLKFVNATNEDGPCHS